MSDRKSHQKRSKRASEKKVPAKRGALSPKIAITGIVAVSLFSAGNVFFALYREGVDFGTLLVLTFLALVTPGMAAALVYYIREKLAG